MPPALAFPVVWTLLYVMMGVALAIVLAARRAKGKAIAIIAFFVQLAMNLVWSPLFFRAHMVWAAFWLITALAVVVLVTLLLFWAIRRNAGLLLLPYLVWLVFAAFLNYQVGVLNPGAEGLEAPALTIQI